MPDGLRITTKSVVVLADENSLHKVSSVIV